MTAKHFLGPRLREGAFIGITAACIYLVLALASYSPSDPGWSATASSDYVSNAVGPTGAWLADVFFSLVGYIAYLFPLMLAYRAWILFQHRHSQEQFDWVTIAIRGLGLVLVMIAGTALAAMNDLGTSAMPQGLGGILGQAVGGSFTDAFSVLGSRLILCAVFLFGVTVFTDLSWLKVMEDVGFWTLHGLRRGQELSTGWWYSLQEKREHQKVQQERQSIFTEHVEK
jgi:S-DNA-T family DNA segregation ATPase FtsK/SpoIIIE